MPTLYIHIPFCRKACTYCDFHFITSLKLKAEMVRAICREIELRKDFFPENAPLQSIYFGGGTPSVLEANEIAAILETVGKFFPLEPGAEITLEANPDDLTPDKLHEFRGVGINRLSIGIQSFAERDLVLMNRSHSATQAITCLENAKAQGFANISADLIFGIPGQTMEEWYQHLQRLANLQIPHLSLYALTVEEKTALAFQVKKGQTSLPEDETYEKQFLAAHDYLTGSGYDHYELSNYALPGLRSRHNSAYWQQVPYLGLGPSAHSFDGKRRMWNVAHNPQYLSAIQAGQTALSETETLGLRDRYHEYIMTHLRKKEGIDCRYIREQFFSDWEEKFSLEINNLLKEEKMVKTSTGYSLTPSSWLISDQIIRDFFLD
ncbi:MAG: radical SAM family heme chaperone HemW [Bacteroidia bacterium]|nr:radical SAM family heme chaperone HemW [Bacteroidia bacterium]